MEEALRNIYKEALVYKDSAPNNSRRKRKAYNDKLNYYLTWIHEVEVEMMKAGYTQDDIIRVFTQTKKQHERENVAKSK